MNLFLVVMLVVMIGVGMLVFVVIFVLLVWLFDFVSKNCVGEYFYLIFVFGYGGLVKLFEVDG